ncbi:MAG: FkbM family methyltransferase [bacterium]|nr:FkbM family methyltransferase [bacterium]
MNQQNISELKSKIEHRYDVFKIENNRIKRIIKDPIRTLSYYSLISLSYLFPFKIKTKTLWEDRISYYLPEGGMIYYYGFYEVNLMNFLINFIKPNMTVVDIGANVGLYTLLSAWLAGEKGKIFAFEPTPRTFETLNENSKIYSNIIPIQKALFDKETDITFFDYGPRYSFLNTINNRIAEHLNFLKKYAKKIDLKTVTFDNIAKEKQIINPDFIKIDVEGAEFSVLKGMTETLTKTRPFVTIEVGGGEEWSDNNKNSIKFLEDNNYEAYEINPLGKISKHTVQASYTYDNLLFIPKEKIDQVKSLMI